MSSSDKDTASWNSLREIAAGYGLPSRTRYQMVPAIYRSPSGSSS